MKYYYGHSLKEALANPPINIRSIKQLEQYKNYYTFVIPETDLKRKEDD